MSATRVVLHNRNSYLKDSYEQLLENNLMNLFQIAISSTLPPCPDFLLVFVDKMEVTVCGTKAQRADTSYFNKANN